MPFKEDIKEAKERLDAWWDREIIDRPVFSYYIPKKSGNLGGYLDAIGQDWTLAEDYDSIDQALEGFESRSEITIFGGESIPSFFPNYGPGILAAVFGVEPKFESETVWFSKPTKPEEIVSLLENVKLNQNNEWYSRLLRITEYAAKRANEKYQISITDIGGVLDILSFFLEPTNIILTMKRQPNIIDTCREIILEKLLKIYDDLKKIILKYCGGFNTWLNVWCRKSWYPVQCDFIAMINPKWFKRFILPDLITQVDHMDYAIHHMDGSYQIPYLDDFLSISRLDGIQWVPGMKAGRPQQGEDEWMPLYKKIQKAKKNIIIDATPDIVPHIYKKLDPKGLFVRTYYTNSSYSELYLPEFMGGNGGKLIEQIIQWAKDENLSNINIGILEPLLNRKNIELQRRAKKIIVGAINSKLKEEN